MRKAYSHSEKLPSDNRNPEIKSARRRRRGDDDKFNNKPIIGNSKSVEDFRDNKDNISDRPLTDRTDKRKERRPSVDDKGKR